MSCLLQGPRVKLLSAFGHKMTDGESGDAVSRVAEIPGDEAQHCGGEEGREGGEEEEKDRAETGGRCTPPVIEQGKNSEDPT